MADLKTILENLDELPAELHEYYTEKDGKFILGILGIDDHPNVKALKNALDRQKTERARLSTEVTTLKERLAKIPEDFDPEAYQALVAELEELKADPAKKGMGDREKAELTAKVRSLEQKIGNMEKTHTAEITKRDTEIKAKDTYLGQLLIDDGLTKALVEAGVDKAFLKATKAMLSANCKVIEEDGKFVAVVESDSGPLEISKYVADWVASDEGKVFIPPAKGGDAGNITNGKGGTQQRTTDTKNPWVTNNLTEQGVILKTDRAKAERLAKAAGKTLPALM